MTYDEKCYELAEHFLSDFQVREKQVVDLAIAIQEAVEQWFEVTELEKEPPRKLTVTHLCSVCGKPTGTTYFQEEGKRRHVYCREKVQP